MWNTGSEVQPECAGANQLDELEAAIGQREISGCWYRQEMQGTDQDFEQVCYKGDTGQIDKDRDRMRTHVSDALGYLMWQECRPLPPIGEQQVSDCLAMETINREHPEYVARKATGGSYKDLYAGRRAVTGERLGTWCGGIRSQAIFTWSGWRGCFTRTTSDRLSTGMRRR
jgi:hypothetical protein